MRPPLHSALVNGRTGDPALYVETLFERRAILFDLGDIAALPARKVQRLEPVFVSHTHIDHFIGFDRLLRLLVERDAVDLVFEVMEIVASGETRSARFRFEQAFARLPPNARI